MIRRRALIGLWLALTVSLPALAQEEKEYFALLMEGKKVGYAIHTRAVADGRVTTSDEVSVTISRLGIPVTVAMTETSIETPQGEPLGFRAVQDLGAMRMTMVGVIDSNGTVELTSASLGSQQKSRMDWPQGALMAEGLRLLTLDKGLTPGTEYEVSLFSPSVMQAIDTKVQIGQKEEVDLLGRVLTLSEMTTSATLPGAGPITTQSYVDDELRTLKSSIPIAGMQVEMIACAREVAMGGNDVLDLIDKMFVKSPERIADVGSTKSITYTLRCTTDANLAIPSTDNQKAEQQADGSIVLHIEPLTAPAGGTFPYRGDDPALLDATKPNRFLQSDRKEIVALARKAVGDTKDSAEAARRIEAFVARHVEERSLSVGYASAAEVAQSRKGDCSEFAVLTTALCRAVGIPAQVCVGVAYVTDFAGIQGFGGHAWAQAYVGADSRGQGGKWLGLDAAFKASGRGGYDPGHIALAVGDGEPANFFNMATSLGQFKIEKLEVRRGR
jgi:hypothetical protein